MEQITASPGITLQLGRAGENGVRRVLFPLERFRVLGEGTAVLVAKLPGDDRLYPIPLTQSGDMAVWTITAAETAASGTGHVQLRYLVGEKVAKTEEYDTWVSPSMDEPTETQPPEPQQSWMDQVLAAGRSAADSAERAAQSAIESKAAAAQAEGCADRAAEEADRAGSAVRTLIDDQVLSVDHVLSSKRTAELLGDAFTARGDMVVCKPVEGYPLSVVSDIAVQQGGVGDPAPDNVRPFKPYTGAVLTRCGKNLISTWDLYYEKGFGIDVVRREDGAVEINGTAQRKLVITLFTGTENQKMPAGAYVFSGAPAGCEYGTLWLEIEYLKENGEKAWRSDSGRTVNVPELSQLCTIYVVIAAGVTVDHLVFQPQLERGTTATAYEPYRGGLCTAEFGQEVYQGIYDWNSGMLTVLSKKFALRVSDMNHPEELFAGWKDVPGLADVVGTDADNVPGSIADAYHLVKVNAQQSMIFLSQSGMTQSRWKERYPDLTLNILVPYREDLRPVIQLEPHTIPALPGINILYTGTGNTAVEGAGRPGSKLEERMKTVEKMLLTIRAGAV